MYARYILWIYQWSHQKIAKKFCNYNVLKHAERNYDINSDNNIGSYADFPTHMLYIWHICFNVSICNNSKYVFHVPVYLKLVVLVLRYIFDLITFHNTDTVVGNNTWNLTKLHTTSTKFHNLLKRVNIRKSYCSTVQNIFVLKGTFSILLLLIILWDNSYSLITCFSYTVVRQCNMKTNNMQFHKCRFKLETSFVT